MFDRCVCSGPLVASTIATLRFWGFWGSEQLLISRKINHPRRPVHRSLNITGIVKRCHSDCENRSPPSLPFPIDRGKLVLSCNVLRRPKHIPASSEQILCIFRPWWTKQMPLKSICNPYLPIHVLFDCYGLNGLPVRLGSWVKIPQPQPTKKNIPTSTYPYMIHIQGICIYPTNSPWMWTFFHPSYPIGPMYDIFTYIYQKQQLNVGKWTIHGSCGYTLEVQPPFFIGSEPPLF